ncbi:MAG: hypothetical protein DMF63_00630 [Acidobacteria bacterium]|nr:MAG: hypothetical protein DMF63_00630 [Acidobacteriota bacterium]
MEALRLYLKAADLFGEGSAKTRLAATLFKIGELYHRVGLNAKAVEYLNVALAFKRELKDSRGEASTLNLLGNSYDGLGQEQKALEAHDLALSIRMRIDDKPGQIVSLSNLSVISSALGENGKAVAYLQRAQVIANLIGDKLGEAVVLHNLAALYDELGDDENTLFNYNLALKIIRETKDASIQGDILNSIGGFYLSKGDYAKARENLYQALQLQYDTAKLSNSAETLLSIGYLHSMLGEVDKALGFYERALGITRTQENRSAESDALYAIGQVYERAGNRTKALEFYNQTLPLRRAVRDKTGEAEVLSSMMWNWYLLKQGRLAVMYGKQAINRFQELRSSIRMLDPNLRKKYLDTIGDAYRALADILIEQGRIPEAEEVLGMLKEEEAFAYQRRDDQVAKELLQKSTLSESEKTAISGYEKIAEQITAIASEYGDLDRERLGYPEGKFPKQARLDELEKQRAGANVAFEKYLEQLKVEFAKSGKGKEVAQVDSSLQSTLREMKEVRTAVVSTIAGEKRLNIIVTTADVQRAHTIDISEVELNKLVADFRLALTSPATGKPIDPRPAGQKLYDILVKPIEGDLAGIKADTIVWSLDGTLRYLPMAALWDKQKGYLAERFANSVITLASRDRLLLPPLKKNWNVFGAGVSASVEGFSALSAVPDELDCIVTDASLVSLSAKPACTTGVIPGRKLLDDKFDERSLRAAMGRYSILHIASHFKLVPGNENDSFLLLGGGDDKRFTVTKLGGLSLAGVELLSLSACNTATPGGAKENGVEIEGFGAVAQERGARSVMATLWPVADPSTRDLMVEFYKRFGTGTETKAESLRRAQLKLMRGSYPEGGGAKPPRADEFAPGPQVAGPPFETDKNAPYSHPYYWAPFILFGNWR